jgi:hypothetical protein
MTGINNNNPLSREEQLSNIRSNMDPQTAANLDSLISSLLRGVRTSQTQAVYDAFNVTNEEASNTTRRILRQNNVQNIEENRDNTD